MMAEDVPKLMGHLNGKLPDTKFLLGDKVGMQDCIIGPFWANMY